MKYYSGLDVSVKETSVCIIDETGKICREVKVISHPDDLTAALKDPAWIQRGQSSGSVLKLDPCRSGFLKA